MTTKKSSTTQATTKAATSSRSSSSGKGTGKSAAKASGKAAGKQSGKPASTAATRSSRASASNTKGAASTRGTAASGRAASSGARMTEEAPMPRPSVLDGGARHDIAGIVVGVVGVALLISVLTPTTGVLTGSVSEALHMAFGVGAFIIPAAIILWAITFFIPLRKFQPVRIVLGMALISLAAISLVGILTPGATEDPSLLFNSYVLSDRGGYVGNGVAWALLSMVGLPVGVVIIAGLVLAGFIVIGLSVSDMVQEISLRMRERREWARIESQERAAQRAREQQQEWLARSEDPEASYTPTALFDPDRPLSNDERTATTRIPSGGRAVSKTRALSSSRAASAEREQAPARTFGCGNDPLGDEDEYSELPDIPNAVLRAAGKDPDSIRREPSRARRRASETTFMRPVPVDQDDIEEYEQADPIAQGRFEVVTTGMRHQGFDSERSRITAQPAQASTQTAKPAPADESAPEKEAEAAIPAWIKSRRERAIAREWWDDGHGNDDATVEDDWSPDEEQAVDPQLVVPGVIDGAPQSLSDFGLAGRRQQGVAQTSTAQKDGASVDASGASDVVSESKSKVETKTTNTPKSQPKVELPWDDLEAERVKEASDSVSRRTREAAVLAQDLPAKPSAPTKESQSFKAGGVKVTPAAKPSAPSAPFQLPSPSMLRRNSRGLQKSAEEIAESEEMAGRLAQTLAEFKVRADVVDWVDGPTCTTYEVQPGEGVRVNKFTSLEDDISRSLARESVRIYAPVHGTSYVGIEVPNTTRQTVLFGDILPHVSGGPLDIAVGLDADGKAVHVDLASLPHLLIAGSTGSGKSVMMNAIICSMLMRDTPQDVRMIMIDPKQVELSGYNGIPHLIMPVVADPRQAAAALQWGVTEMDRRYQVFANLGVRKLSSYNDLVASVENVEREFPLKHLPSVVIIIDELTDLMMVAKKDVEASIVRIAQLGRACGIHLVMATQRPSADVVTGLIKANVPNRMGFKVATGIDSKVVLDQTGAEKLLGHGDMLFLQTSWGDRPRRIQGCFLSDDEIAQIVDHLKGQSMDDVECGMAPLNNGQPSLPLDDAVDESGSAGNEDDPLALRAAQLVVENQLGSTSMIQRRLKLGYARAGRVMDMLEEMGVVGPARGSKPRDVLIHDLDELATLFGTSVGGEDV